MLRQYVRLTGLGCSAFDEYSEAIDAIQLKFMQHAGFGVVEGLKKVVYEGDYAVDMHTRYLTERRLAETEKHIPFTTDVDPNQALEEVRGGNLIRIADNIVQYSRRTERGERGPR